MIEKISARINLGSLNQDELNFLIEKTNISNCTLNQRVIAWGKHFLGTKYMFESKLPKLLNDEMRVDISSMDCITFIYNTLALAGSTDISSFIKSIFEIIF